MFQFAKNLESGNVVDPRTFSRGVLAGAGGYAFAAGVLGLTGWLANVPRLTDWFGTGIAMFFNTCLLAILAGAGLLILASAHRRAELLTRILGGLLTLAGGALLFQHLTGINLGIDTLVVDNPWATRAAVSPGRPGPPASAAFTLIGIALLVLSTLRGRQARRVVSFLGLGIATLSLLSIIGYVFQADMLFALARHTGISFQSATIIFVLGLGLVGSVPDQEPVRTLLRGTSASLFARRALPALVVAPVALVLLSYWGYERDYFDVGMGLALLALSLIVVSCALLWWCVASVTQYETSVLAGNKRLRQLVSLMPAAVYTCDHEGRITYFNRRAAEIWGRKPEIGDEDEKFCGSFRLWHPDGTPLPHAETPMAEALKHGTSSRDREVVIERPDGSGVVVSVNIDPLYDANGIAAGAINVFQDITAKKQVEVQSEEIHRQLRELIEALPAAVYTTDAEGRITMFNDAAIDFSGRVPEIGTDQWCVSWKLYWPDGTEMPHDECPMAIALREGRAVRGCEAIAERPDGSRIHFIPYPTPIRDAKGNIIGAVNMLVDITERKRFEERIEESNNELKDLAASLENRVQERTQKLQEQSEQLRRLAVQLVSAEESERKRIAQILHDHLQQLLIAARMQLQLIDSGAPSDEAVRKSREFIQQACDASRSLTAELRPPVLYESGLGPALQFLARKFQDQYGFTLHLSIALDAEPASSLLKAMLYQAVQELVMNAMKYAGTQECFLSLDRLPNRDIRVTVHDRGAGFDVDSIDRKGFGLFSIRETVNALGGACTIESEPGYGARFALRIPDDDKLEFARRSADRLPEITRTVKKETARTKRGALTILLADDHESVRQSLATLLGAQPFIDDVLESENGKEAVELARTADPDIVLMDLNMPVMNGLEATRMLRELNPNAKIIGLSVQSEPETAQAMKDAGAMRYWSKSEDTGALIDAIKELASV